MAQSSRSALATFSRSRPATTPGSSAASHGYVSILGRCGTTAEPPNTAARILASILFTDIVDSTATAQRLGDGGWLDAVAAHNERVQFVLHRYSGRLVKTTGDGILALFDGAERAVRAAAALHDAVASLQMQPRAGIHTGKVELVPGDVRGVAVHAAARVMAIAGPGETLVSGTTRDLLDVTGSDSTTEAAMFSRVYRESEPSLHSGVSPLSWSHPGQ